MKISFRLCSKPSSIKPIKTPLISPSPSLKVFITEFDGSKPIPNPNAKKPKIIPAISNEWTESIVKFQTRNSLLVTKSNDDGNIYQLKNDLERLPDHRGMTEFECMPVEEFAAAYARGYGFKPNKEVRSWISCKKDHPFNMVLPYRNQTGLGFVEEANMNAAAKEDVIMASRRKRRWEEKDKFWGCTSWSQELEEYL